jgi:hypothetical protein
MIASEEKRVMDVWIPYAYGNGGWVNGKAMVGISREAQGSRLDARLARKKLDRYG